MFYAGEVTGMTVLVPVEISGQWTQLGETVDSLAFDASATASDMETASSSWTGLVSSYEEPATQEVVRAAFDQVPEVTRAWSDVMAKAADVLQGFATEAASLESRASGLHAEAARLQAWLWVSGLVSGLAGDLTAEDELLQRQIVRHNDDVLALNSRWEQLVQETAETLDSIAGGGGLEEDVPEVTAEGGVYSVTAGGSSASGDGSGDGLLSAALIQMVRSGAESKVAVEEAQDRFETLTGVDVTGQDVKDFYAQLKTMSAEEIERFSEQTPAVHENSIPQPSSKEEYDNWPDGKAGAQWWRELEDAGVQEAMRTHLPLVVGNVQGVPYEDRHKANKKALERLQENEDYDQWDKNLQEIKQSLAPDGSDNGEDPPRMLLSLDIGQETAIRHHPHSPEPSKPRGWPRQPLAAISVGDPDTADTTSFGVPGMASGTHDMTGDVLSAKDIHEELSNLDRGATHAAIAWVGYDPPPEAGDKGTLDVFDDDRASQGGWKLAYALDGFQETRAAGDEGPKDPRVNVHAHSYGTNTSAHALAAVKHEVDTFSMYGSAGIPADLMDRVAGKDGAANTDDVEAGDLNVKTNEEGDPMVFASESSWDWTARVGRTFGDDRIDPTDESFGAQVNYSGGMFESDAVDGEGVTGHSRTFEDSPDEYGYLDPETEHFRNLTRTLAGVEDDEITTQDDYEDGVSWRDTADEVVDDARGLWKDTF